MKQQLVIKGKPALLNDLYSPICRNIGNRKVPAIIKNKKAKEFNKIVRMEAVRSKIKCFDGDVSMKIDFCYKGKRNKDIDGFLKNLLDALNGIAYHDDEQIVELFVRKHRNQKEDELILEISKI